MVVGVVPVGADGVSFNLSLPFHLTLLASIGECPSECQPGTPAEVAVPVRSSGRLEATVHKEIKARLVLGVERPQADLNIQAVQTVFFHKAALCARSPQGHLDINIGQQLIGAILALMPLALGIGVGAQMQQPLAVAVIGGFVVGLPLLLLVLPSIMLWIYKGEK